MLAVQILASQGAVGSRSDCDNMEGDQKVLYPALPRTVKFIFGSAVCSATGTIQRRVEGGGVCWPVRSEILLTQLITCLVLVLGLCSLDCLYLCMHNLHSSLVSLFLKDIFFSAHLSVCTTRIWLFSLIEHLLIYCVQQPILE